MDRTTCMGMLRYRESDDAPLKRPRQGPARPELARLRSPQRQALRLAGLPGRRAVGNRREPAPLPPRLIAKDMGGFNGFEVGPDGMLYGPLWFKRQVVKIDPANGAITVINSDFQMPAAANLDGKGNLWVVDTEDRRAVPASNWRRAARPWPSSSSRRSTTWRSRPTARSTCRTWPTTRSRPSTPPPAGCARSHRGKLAVPAGLQDRRRSTLGRRHLLVPQGRCEDRRSAATSSACRRPTWSTRSAVGVSSTHFALSSWFTGTVQLVERATLKTSAMIHWPEGADGRDPDARRQRDYRRNRHRQHHCARAGRAKFADEGDRAGPGRTGADDHWHGRRVCMSPRRPASSPASTWRTAAKSDAGRAAWRCPRGWRKRRGAVSSSPRPPRGA